MDAQTNYISRLNEYAQKKGLTVDFDLVDTTGLDHMRLFTMRVMINGNPYPEGVGQNKKIAKHNAAKNALSLLDNEEPAQSEMRPSTPARNSPVSQANYVCWLNEHSQKTGLRFICKEFDQVTGSPIRMFSFGCKFVCGDKEFPEATGKTKKEAKEAAARMVYEILKKQETEQVTDENSIREENPNTQNLSTSLHHLKLSARSDTECTTSVKNYIGRLHEYCQKSKQAVNFKIVEKGGRAHDPVFVYKVIIGEKEYPDGMGRTAKDAKQEAARLALSELYGYELSSQISTSSMSESSDGVSPPQKSSNNQTTSESIIFAHSHNVQQSSDVKPKRQLAANFQNSPINNKKVQPSTKPAAVPNQSIKSRFLEDFDSVTKTGKGGFGHVFKARRKLEDTFFAVKIVKHTKKALREVSALCRLDHRNIVRYHTSWTEMTEYREEASETYSTSSSGSGCDYLYIQMEYCEGDTLYEWIEERNNNPKKYTERRKEAAEILKQVLDAVNYVHSHKLFHRDLKPVNIMFGHDGGVKVGDFGLVTKDTGDDGSLLERTRRAGTRSYMSPEQQQQQVYDKKVDIYAMGLIYFELVWRFGTRQERQKQWPDIRKKNFPQGFSERFEFEHKLIEQMLCEDPKERPEAEKLLADMDQYSMTTAATGHNGRKENRTY